MPTIAQHPTPAAFAAERALRWLEGNPLFLDTETTGLQSDDEVCDLAIINAHGAVLFNSFICPTQPIPAEAYAIHGISDRDVSSAPSYADVLPQLRSLLDGQRVITYNASFDERLLRQSAAAHGLQAAGLRCTWWDAMEEYARFHGDWNPKRQTFRWQTLSNAANQCGLVSIGAHRALADAKMCLQLIRHMAAQVPPPPAGEHQLTLV